MQKGEYKRIFDSEFTHWWYLGMQKITDVFISSVYPKGEITILDAGCGVGGMMIYLKKFGKVYGFDISPEALKYCCQRNLHGVKLASIEKIPYSTKSFDLVTTFDVLYHQSVQNDMKALREIFRVLKPGGMVLVRVPAYNWLRGSHDNVVATRQRYSKYELKGKLANAGFSVQRLTYANSLLFFPALIKRGVEMLVRTKTQSDVQPLPRFINTILKNILYLEALLIERIDLPWGLSLVALARKPK